MTSFLDRRSGFLMKFKGGYLEQKELADLVLFFKKKLDFKREL